MRFEKYIVEGDHMKWVLIEKLSICFLIVRTLYLRGCEVSSTSLCSDLVSVLACSVAAIGKERRGGGFLSMWERDRECVNWKCFRLK